MNRRITSVTLSVCLFTDFGAIFQGTSQPFAVGQESKERPAPVVTVPLEKAYATFKQEDLNRIDPRPSREGEKSVREMAAAVGPSNIFLVHGADIASAVRSTESAFRGMGADRPLRGNPPTKDKEIWVVAHLGVKGSSPPAFELQRVEFSGHRIRVSFTHKESSSLDTRAYLVWIPLGELKHGEYALELFDTNRKTVMLARVVRVE